MDVLIPEAIHNNFLFDQADGYFDGYEEEIFVGVVVLFVAYVTNNIHHLGQRLVLLNALKESKHLQEKQQQQQDDLSTQIKEQQQQILVNASPIQFNSSETTTEKITTATTTTSTPTTSTTTTTTTTTIQPAKPFKSLLSFSAKVVAEESFSKYDFTDAPAHIHAAILPYALKSQPLKSVLESALLDHLKPSQILRILLDFNNGARYNAPQAAMIILTLLKRNQQPSRNKFSVCSLDCLLSGLLSIKSEERFWICSKYPMFRSFSTTFPHVKKLVCPPAPLLSTRSFTFNSAMNPLPSVSLPPFPSFSLSSLLPSLNLGFDFGLFPPPTHPESDSSSSLPAIRVQSSTDDQTLGESSKKRRKSQQRHKNRPRCVFSKKEAEKEMALFGSRQRDVVHLRSHYRSQRLAFHSTLSIINSFADEEQEEDRQEEEQQECLNYLPRPSRTLADFF